MRRIVWVLACDRCQVRFRGSSSASVRDEAGEAGWRPRPASGSGCRSAPDLCPGCKAKADQAAAAAITRFMDR